jgi:hypothetical protein
LFDKGAMAMMDGRLVGVTNAKKEDNGTQCNKQEVTNDCKDGNDDDG